MATTSSFHMHETQAAPDVIAAEDEELEEEIVGRFQHVRTASVIVESGARVRRTVTLAPDDESPFDEDDEHSALLSGDLASGPWYSSFVSGIRTREVLPLEKDWFVSWICSENPKRFEICSELWLMTGYSSVPWRIGWGASLFFGRRLQLFSAKVMGCISLPP
jgi:hypothetical protein